MDLIWSLCHDYTAGVSHTTEVATAQHIQDVNLQCLSKKLFGKRLAYEHVVCCKWQQQAMMYDVFMPESRHTPQPHLTH